MQTNNKKPIGRLILYLYDLLYTLLLFLIIFDFSNKGNFLDLYTSVIISFIMIGGKLWWIFEMRRGLYNGWIYHARWLVDWWKPNATFKKDDIKNYEMLRKLMVFDYLLTIILIVTFVVYLLWKLNFYKILMVD